MKNELIFILLSNFVASIEAQCWKRSYGRGIGQPLSMCRNGTELNGALCYEKCQSGYQGKPFFSDFN